MEARAVAVDDVTLSAPAGPPGRARRGPAWWTSVALLTTAGAGAGLSALHRGYYDLATWGPIALGALAVAFGLTLAAPRRPPTRAIVAVAALAALWGWAMLSRDWSTSPGQAALSASRWALYAALLLALVLLARDRVLARVAIATATIAIVGVAVHVVARMLGEAGDNVFFALRLNSPLGYVNGQAAFFLLAFWPLVAFAERSRRRPLAALAVGAAAFLAALLVMSQSRGIALAFLVSLLVVVAAVPGRSRRLWMLLAIAAGVVAIGDPLIDVYRDPTSPSRPDLDNVHRAAQAAVAMAVAVGLLWGLVDALAGAWASRGPRAARALSRASAGALIVLALAGAGTAALSADAVGDWASGQYHAFVDLGDTATGSRFLSGAGHRYDYWRIAWNEFRSEPVKGVGAGGYEPDYYLERRTTEDITQPHSIELQALAELGLPGLVLVLAFLGAVLAGLWRMARAARRDTYAQGIAVAAGGTFVAWTVHTSVDWLHVIPGVTAIALCSAAALLGRGATRAEEDRASAGPRPERALRWATLAVVALDVGLAATMIGRTTLADRYRSEGQRQVAADPRGALENARRAYGLDADTMETYYLASAAYARLNRYGEARGTLFQALEREPRNFVTWALIGDLAVRRGAIEDARTAYGRASRLDPRNSRLRELERDPESATR